MTFLSNCWFDTRGTIYFLHEWHHLFSIIFAKVSVVFIVIFIFLYLLHFMAYKNKSQGMKCKRVKVQILRQITNGTNINKYKWNGTNGY